MKIILSLIFLLSWSQLAEAGINDFYKIPPLERNHRPYALKGPDELFIIPDRRLGIIQLGMTVDEVHSILGEPDMENAMEQYDVYHIWGYGHTRLHFMNGILEQISFLRLP
jgi:hypothetical protein